MPAKKSEKTTTPSLDDLLEVIEKSEVTVEESAPEAPVVPEVTSFEQTELEALKAELALSKAQLEAQNASSAEEGHRVIPEDELTPEQREIRYLKDQLAQAQGLKVGTQFEDEEVLNGEGILIHILEDGFNASYRGQEIIFGPKAYEETKNRFGVSWLHMTDEEQYERWGSLQFRKGPWPGKREYEDDEARGKSIRSVARISK